jgi:hypothetical protein
MTLRGAKDFQVRGNLPLDPSQHYLILRRPPNEPTNPARASDE